MKHNKIKNTAILFELLSRAVMHETINTPNKPVSINIIKRHFKQGSNLLAELQLYQSMMLKSDHDSQEVFDLTLKTRKGLDESELTKEKYALVKSIKKHYDLKTFLESRLSNYKLSASVYNLFEGTNIAPNEFLDCKKLIIEQIKGSSEQEEDLVEAELRNQDKDVRNLSLKIIVEKFNGKYKNLNDRQKVLLNNYITEDTDSEKFKNFIFDEVGYITEALTEILEDMDDDIAKIKINETISLTQQILSAKHIKDEHLSAMLKYYELIEEIQ